MLKKEEIFEFLKEIREHFKSPECKEEIKKKFSSSLPYDLEEEYFSMLFSNNTIIEVTAEKGEIINSDKREVGNVSYITFIRPTTKKEFYGGAYGNGYYKIKPSSKEGFFKIIEKCRKESLNDAITNLAGYISSASDNTGKNAIRKYDFFETIQPTKYYSNFYLNFDYDLSEIEEIAINISKNLDRSKVVDESGEIEILSLKNEKMLVNSEGTEIIYDPSSTFEIYMNAFVKTGIGKIKITEKIREKNLEDILKEKKIEKKILDLEKKIINQKNAINIKPGTYDILFIEKSYADAVHEAGAAHLFSLSYQVDDMVGIFSLEDIGKKIGNENLSVILDPFYPGKGEWGYYNIDDEGTPAKKVNLISNGFLENFICDRKSKAKLKFLDSIDLELNGHARAEDIKEYVEPRVSNLLVRWNQKLKNEKEILYFFIEMLKRKGKSYGILFNSSAGEVNLLEEEREDSDEDQEVRKTICTLYPSEAFLINLDGKITPILKNISLNFMPRSIFENIAFVGGEYVKENHYCGSDSGCITTLSESPSLVVVENLTIEKSRISNKRE
ncbi:MAG: metallopeptidase TldD-related protein [Candidatus Pacearchaeota archaeon]